MDKELKAKWVAALRSGQYKQGKGKLLANDGAMCCLGVLEAVCGTDVETIAAFAADLCITKSRRKTTSEEDYELREIPLDVRDKLADLNDGWLGHKSFAEIADFIEANL